MVTVKAAPPPPRVRPEVAIGAGASLGVGFSSSAVVLGRVFGALVWPHLSVALGGEVSNPTTTRRADGAGFSQQALLGEVAVCGGLRPLSACILGRAGQLRFEPQDVDVPVARAGLIAQSGLRLAVSGRITGPTYIALRLDGLVNLTRWTVGVDQVPIGPRPAWRPAWASMWAYVFSNRKPRRRQCSPRKLWPVFSSGRRTRCGMVRGCVRGVRPGVSWPQPWPC